MLDKPHLPISLLAHITCVRAFKEAIDEMEQLEHPAVITIVSKAAFVDQGTVLEGCCVRSNLAPEVSRALLQMALDSLPKEDNREQVM